MVLLAVLTGLRVGEILALRWQVVDLDRGELRVVQAVYPGCLVPRLSEDQRQQAHNSASRSRDWGAQEPGAVVPRTDSRAVSLFIPERDSPQRHQPAPEGLEIFGKAGRVPWVSWHTFRRTHATLLQLAGGSAKDAQAQIGHSQIATTLGIYTIPVPAHQREAVANGDKFRAAGETGIGQTTLIQ